MSCYVVLTVCFVSTYILGLIVGYKLAMKKIEEAEEKQTE